MKENLKKSCYLLFLFFCLSLFQAKTVFSNDLDSNPFLNEVNPKEVLEKTLKTPERQQETKDLLCEDIKKIDFKTEPNHVLSKSKFISSETIKIIESYPELFSEKLQTITQKNSFLTSLYNQLYVEFNKEMSLIAKEKNLSIYEMLLSNMYDEAFSKASEEIFNRVGTNGRDNLFQIFSVLDNDIYYSLNRRIKADPRKAINGLLHLEKEANEIKNVVKKNIFPLIKIKTHQIYNNYDHSYYISFFSDTLDGSKSFFTQKLIHDLEEDFSWAIEDIYAKSNCDLLEEIYSRLLEKMKVALQKALNYVRTRPVTETSYHRYSSFAETEEEIEQRIKNYIQFQLYVVSDMLTEEKKYARSTGEDSYRIVETKINNLINVNQERRDPKFAYELYLKALFQKKDDKSNFEINGYTNLKRLTSEKFFGIGVRLKPTNEGNLEVLEVLKNPDKEGKKYPSERAGIKEKDVLIAVKESENSDWYNVSQISFLKVMEKIRGPENTFVYLKVKRYDKEGSLLFKIERNEIKTTSIRHFIVDVMRGNKKHKVALIKFKSFMANSLHEDFKNILSTLRDEKVESLVIDLTENGGGEINTTVAVTGLFMENSIPMKISLGKGNKVGELIKDPDSSIHWKKPLIILTSTLSASGSEIMAGSLKAYRRAIIVGDRTYGKGTAQTMISYFQHFVRLTTALYIIPDGSSPQQIGVKPDISFPTLSFSFQTSESKLTYWGNEESFLLPPEETGAGTSWTPVTQEMLSKLKTESKKRVAKNEKDFSRYLVNKPSWSEEKNPGEYQINYEETKAKEYPINYLDSPDIKEALEIATDAISIVK